MAARVDAARTRQGLPPQLVEAVRRLDRLDPDGHDAPAPDGAAGTGDAAADAYRLRWEDVPLDGYRLLVRKAKGAAGTNRRRPIAERVREVLRQAALRFASEPDDPVAPVSVLSGKLAERATAA